MSIRARLEDAQILSGADRQEGAFIQVLVAAAATSRKRYTREIWDDSESFKNFIYDEMGVITGAFKYNVCPPFQGKNTPLEDIFYHHLRCQLMHDGEMPETIEFTAPELRDGKRVSIVRLGEPWGFPVAWIEGLATAVWLSPENDELWQEDLAERRKAREQLGDLGFDGLYCRRPGKQTRKEKNVNDKLAWTHHGIPFRVSFPQNVTRSKIADALQEKVDELRR